MGKKGAKPIFATLPGLILGCFVCCALWGSAFPCIKIGYELFGIESAGVASRLLFAGLRFTLAGVMVVTGTSLATGRALVPARRDLRPILVLACFQTVGQYIFFYLGLSVASGLTSSIVESSSNFLAILFAVFLFRTERLRANKLLGCIVGFAGVVLINMGGSDASGLSFSWNGEGFIFISTIAGALSTCLIGIFSRRHNGVLLSGWQFLVGGIVLTAIGLAMGGRLDPPQLLPAVALLVYMAFISAMAYSLWSKLLEVNPVSRVSIFGFMNPVFGVILSALLLGEGSQIDPFVAVASLVLVCAGIIVVNRPST